MRLVDALNTSESVFVYLALRLRASLNDGAAEFVAGRNPSWHMPRKRNE